MGWATRFAIPLFLALLAESSLIRAQRVNEQEENPQEKLQVDVNLVTVRFTVRDAAGNFVNTLGEEDFSILEGNRPQEITFFQPPRNRKGSTSPLWLAFLIDVSGSTSATRSEEILAAHTFLDNVPQITQVGVFGFTDVLLPFQDFTPHRELALRAFNQARQHLGKTALYDSLNLLMERMANLARPGDQKAVILISDGIDEAYSKAPTSIQLANRHQIKIYSVLVPSAAQLYIAPSQDPSPTLQQQESLQREQERAFLELATATGGLSFSGFEAILDLDDTLAQINDDIFGNLYTLGFHTEDPFLDKRSRDIRVLVRQPQLTVSALFQNLPERQNTKRLFVSALFRRRATLQLPLESQAGRFREIGAELDILPARRDGATLGLPFRIKISPFTLTDRDSRGGIRSQLGVIAVLFDGEGQEVVQLREVFRVQMSSKDLREGRGVVYNNKLFAPPGRYLLKIALIEIPSWKLTTFEDSVRLPEL